MPKKPTAQQVADLFQAIEEGDVGAAREVLESGVPADSISKDRLSPLMLATMRNDHPMMVALLDAGANPNLGGSNCKLINEYRTPLNYACAKGLRSPILLLLDRGANPALTSKDGMGAGHHLMVFGMVAGKAVTPLWLRFAESTLKRMLDLGVSANSADSGGGSLLREAMSSHLPLSVIEMLLERGADARQKSPNGFEAIHWAGNKGRIDVLQLLVGQGIPIDATDERGRTALFYIMEPEVGEALVALGADLNHQDIAGNTPLHDMLEREINTREVSERVKFLLSAGARLDIRNARGKLANDIAKKRKLVFHSPLLTAAAARQAMERARVQVKHTATS